MLRIAKTENGLVRGLPAADPRITSFKGIPFAAPPVGELRWRAPQPAESWEGVRDCFECAPISMQYVPGANPEDFYAREWHVDPQIPMSEEIENIMSFIQASTHGIVRPVSPADM